MSVFASSFPAGSLAWGASIFFLAGLVKGVTGMGLPTVAMGLLSTIVAPVVAAGLMLVPSFVTNVWQLLAGPGLAVLARRLRLMLAGIAVGTFAGAAILARGPARGATMALGGALILYAGSTLLARRPAVPVRSERWLSLIVGLATGVITGATGVFVIPAVPYLQALNLDRDGLVQALGLSFTVSTVTLAAGLWWQGAFVAHDLGWSLLAVAPALLGMRVGQTIRQRVSPATFRRWFLILLMGLGVELVLRSLSAA
ncbi:MAG: sulfite exporter TauE/SafE family protein [Azospirillaceae bacterium]|nr:sulfite exporter TauE/SafE family protein [Azospirillaceae bacterium]